MTRGAGCASRPAVRRLRAVRARARRRWSSGWSQVVPDLALSRSYTSRPARPGEADGVDYNFVTRARFEAMIAADAFLEWADVFGNLYGTLRADTRARARLGPRPGAGHRRPGRAAGADRGAPTRSASSCCRRRSTCSSSGCAAAARTARTAIQRRLADGAGRGRRVRRVRLRRRQRRARGVRRAAARDRRWPSARGCGRCARRPNRSCESFLERTEQ